MTAIINIKLSHLIISPKNVRVVGTTKQEDKELTASIRARGILQNLVVVPVASDSDTYEVVAGGRRFAVLNALQSSGEIAHDFEVPCSIRQLNEATEISLSENIRAEMHPADVFVAFKRLSDEGNSDKQIAEHFGKSVAEVKRLLKLATIAPELVDHFRAGKLSLDCIMAFTVTDNQERQIACYKEMSRGYWNSRQIKQYLLGAAISSTSREAKFIGLAAYKKAGGTISTDLFSEESYWTDSELIARLIDEKLAAEAEKLKANWSWVDVSKAAGLPREGYIQIQGEPINVPKKVTERIALIEREMEEIENADPESEESDCDDRYNTLEEELMKLNQKLDTYVKFTPKQKEVAGAVVSIDYDGSLLIKEGLVRKADKKRLDSLTNSTDGQSGEHLNEHRERVESEVLHGDLGNYYGQAFQAHLSQKTDLCYDLLVYGLAAQIIEQGGMWELTKISCTARSFSAIGIEETSAAEILRKTELSLNLAWMTIESTGERFTAFQALSKEEKARILAYSVARSTSTTIGRQNDLQDRVETQMEFDLSEYWLPNADNYFSRIKRNALMDIGVALIGVDFLTRYEKAKKMEVADTISKMPERGKWLPSAFLK